MTLEQIKDDGGNGKMKSESEKIFDFLMLTDKAKESVIEFHYPNDSTNISLFDALDDVPIPADLLENYDKYISVLNELIDGKEPQKIKNLSALFDLPNDKNLLLSEYNDKSMKFFALKKEALKSVPEVHFLSNDMGENDKQPISVYDALQRLSIPSDLAENYTEYIRILQELADNKEPQKIEKIGFLFKLPKNHYLEFVA